MDRIKRAIKKVDKRVDDNSLRIDANFQRFSKLDESLNIIASDVEALKAELLAAKKKE